jgi:hypothetical protein
LEAEVQSATSSRHLFRSLPAEKTSLSRAGSNRKDECVPFYGFSLSFHFGRDARLRHGGVCRGLLELFQTGQF